MTTSQINISQLRPPGDDWDGPIIQVGLPRRPEAIARLVMAGHHPDRDHAQRFIDYASAHHINLDGLWSRLDRQGRIQSTVLTVPSPGRTAMVFASRADGRAHVRSLGGLIDHAARQLAAQNVNLAQALVDPNDMLDREAFLAGGFSELAVLAYMERPLRPVRGNRNAAIDWPADCKLVPFRDALWDELIAVLDASYEDTLDCPALRGRRRTCDILEGHRASGLFNPNLWTVLHWHNEAVGALLLNPSADHHSVELVYFGLAKRARGMGLGVRLLRHGMKLVEGRHERLITLAVDENNAPAIRLYDREGFRPAVRRRALIRPL